MSMERSQWRVEEPTKIYLKAVVTSCTDFELLEVK